MHENGFRLDGRTYEMRGVNVHHDHGPLGAKAFDRSEERRVRILKDAGYNAIRTAHNPFPPAFLEACDRLGMFVYDEFVDMWDQGKRANDYSVHFAKNWRKDVRRWLAADRNHPSVVLWSIGNELGASGAPIPQPGADADARAARGKQVADLVRSIDPTRPVVEGGGQGIWFFAAANPMPEWPADAYTDVGDVHYIHDYGLRPQGNPGKAYLQSESFPATAYDDWKMVTDHPYAVGDFVWTGWDYLGETGLGISEVVPFRSGPPLSSTDDPSGILQVGGIIGPYPYYGAACGDFDLIGQPKPQLRYRQVVWGDSPLELQVERPVGEGLEQRAMCWGWFDELESWTWDVPQGRPMRVHAYTTGDLVTLLLDGVPVGTVPVTPADKCVASFDVPYVPGTLTAVAYRLGEEIGRKELTTVGEPARLRLRSEEGRLPRRRDALGHVLVEVLDAQGRLVPDAVRKVRFDVRGGDLVAVGNGNSHNVDSFTRPRRHTYHGVAMVYVRPRKGSDRITVRAESSGLRPAVTRIPVRD